jgi:hypothetical protein
MNPYKSTASAQTAWLGQIQTEAQNEMTSQTGLTIDITTLVKGTDANGNTTYSNTDIIVTIDDKSPKTGERRVSVTAHFPFKTIIVYPGLPSSIDMKRMSVMRSIR